MGSKATSFLGRRSGSFSNTDLDPAESERKDEEDVTLAPQQSLPAREDPDMQSADTVDTESVHSTVSTTPAESQTVEPEINTSITDIDIMNEIRKDVNNAKRKIATEAKFTNDGKVVFESHTVKIAVPEA